MKGKKHIVVIGWGEFGRELAQQLAKECEILALDREEALVATLDKVQRALIVDVLTFTASVLWLPQNSTRPLSAWGKVWNPASWPRCI